jgi:hypothetical protein
MSTSGRDRFFLAMSVVLLAIVLVGFGRTLYLRAFFDVPAIPPRAYVHGIILTAWFALFCCQAALVATGRPGLHRRLGVLSALVAVAVIVGNVSVLAGISPRLRAVLEDGCVDAAFIVRAIWGDFTSTVVFAAFVSLALLFRHRGEVHRRLMLLASASIIGPALGRIAFWPAFKDIHNLSLILSGASLVFFLGALVVYDLARTKHVHPATLIGGAFRVLVWIGTGALAASDFGTRLVLRLA